jgi:hypothetical protein
VHTWTDLVLEAAFAGNAAQLDFSVLAQQAEEVLGERLAGWQETSQHLLHHAPCSVAVVRTTP